MISKPTKLILIGSALLLLGVILPFLMILHIVKTSFLLSFLTYAAQVSGLFIGTLGAFSFAVIHKKR